jgi:predicted cupin superfamily sugar epimerase
MASKTAANWIDELTLKRHPEGGWFRRIYESEMRVDGSRPAMTSIYYLLDGSDFSAFHRLKQDEQWHFYAGAPLTVHVIHCDGTSSHTTLSSAGPFQMTVRAGDLFGTTVNGDYALVGCTVAPGFDYAEFELPARGSLLEIYPEHKNLILQLTRD